MLDYLVLYESETGNTKKIATEIFSVLPGMEKDLLCIDEHDTLPEAEVYFVGFCVHRGTCSMKLADFLSGLSGKKIALFGTCGAGNSASYYKKLENGARIWIEDDNTYLGGFFCQGRMPLSVRQKYESHLHHGSAKEDQMIQQQLQNFDEAMIHPNQDDCTHARAFASECLKKLG